MYRTPGAIGHRECACQLHTFTSCVCSRKFQLLSAPAPAQAASAFRQTSILHVQMEDIASNWRGLAGANADDNCLRSALKRCALQVLLRLHSQDSLPARGSWAACCTG